MPRSRPRLHDRGEREPVDLRVDRGDIPAAVTQHLPDLRQAPARAEHLGRGGMPQTMSADRPAAPPAAGAAHDLRDRTGREAAITARARA